MWKDELYRVNQSEFWYIFLREWSIPYLDIFHIWKRNANLQEKREKKWKYVLMCFYSATILRRTSCQTYAAFTDGGKAWFKECIIQQNSKQQKAKKRQEIFCGYFIDNRNKKNKKSLPANKQWTFSASEGHAVAKSTYFSKDRSKFQTHQQTLATFRTNEILKQTRGRCKARANARHDDVLIYFWLA